MNIEQKERLEKLKGENKERQCKKEIENNILVLECKEALGTGGKVLEQEEQYAVYSIFKERIPFLPWGIDWEQFNTFHKIEKLEEIYEKCKCKEFYIIWGNRFPIIRSDIVTIINNIYDVCAVEADTWVFSVDYSEIIEFYHEGAITFGVVNKDEE